MLELRQYVLQTLLLSKYVSWMYYDIVVIDIIYYLLGHQYVLLKNSLLSYLTYVLYSYIPLLCVRLRIHLLLLISLIYLFQDALVHTIYNSVFFLFESHCLLCGYPTLHIVLVCVCFSS